MEIEVKCYCQALFVQISFLNCVKIWDFSPVISSMKFSHIDLGNKTCSLCIHSLVKTKANVWENSRAAREFWQTLPRFSPGFESTENMFYFFYKMINSRLKEKDDIRSAYIYFSFFHESVNSHNLEIEPTILLTSFSCFIELWKHSCKPIKTHVLSKLFYKKTFTLRITTYTIFNRMKKWARRILESGCWRRDWKMHPRTWVSLFEGSF